MNYFLLPNPKSGLSFGLTLNLSISLPMLVSSCLTPLLLHHSANDIVPPFFLSISASLIRFSSSILAIKAFLSEKNELSALVILSPHTCLNILSFGNLPVQNLCVNKINSDSFNVLKVLSIIISTQRLCT